MYRIFFLLALAALVAGCTKTESTRTSGTDTIDNITYQSTTYYVYGFSFSSAKLVPTTQNPGPDIVLYVNTDIEPYRLTLQTSSLHPSFSKVGDYNDESAATAAFNELKTVTVNQFLDMADPIKANQVWIYRDGSGHYTKFRIISTVNETRNNLPYGECKFQWVHQPADSNTFPD